MTAETREEREARWAKGAAEQEAYRNRPERRAELAARIVAGLCVGRDWCITHDVKMDLGHDLDINGTTNPDGTARND